MIPFLASILIIVAIILLLDLSPERVTSDILKITSPKQSLNDRVNIAKGKKKSLKITETINYISQAMTQTGKNVEFTFICAASLILFVGGGVFAVMIDNIFLVPILAFSLALLPFSYAKSLISHYEKQTSEEIETALSIITTSYIRSDDIVMAVKENIIYLKPPVKYIFQGFLGEITAINSDTKKALTRLRSKIDNEIFKEWVDTLIACQDDRTLNDTLLPILTKLTDVRIVNNELKTMLYEPKKEYYMMLIMVVGNIPLLYMLNKDWYNTLMFSTAGKITLAICGGVILITSLLLSKYTKPIRYRR